MYFSSVQFNCKILTNEKDIKTERGKNLFFHAKKVFTNWFAKLQNIKNAITVSFFAEQNFATAKNEFTNKSQGLENLSCNTFSTTENNYLKAM